VSAEPRDPTVALVASRIREDELRLMAALERRRIRFVQVDSRKLVTVLGDPAPPWRVALNREIGSTRAMYAAEALETAGVRVINSAAAVAVCRDKWRTSVALHQAGLPTPRTALAQTPEAALEALATVGYPAVIKPLVGSWGRMVAPVPDPQVAATVLEYVGALPSPQSHVVYVQELVEKPDRDIRVIVIDGRVIGAVYRRATGWRTNVATGAVTEPCPVTDDLAKAAVRAADAVRAEIAGVDLLERADGSLVVLEVNQGVEFSGFHRALGDRVDVADEIVSHLVARTGP